MYRSLLEEAGEEDLVSACCIILSSVVLSLASIEQ